MEQVVQQIVNGLALGFIYALIALGYSLVYGIIRLINFAHGDIIMVGAYVALFSYLILGVGFVPALLIAMVTCSLLGVTIERVAYKPLREAPRIAALITAIGVSFLLEYGFQLFFGPQQRAFPEFFKTHHYKLGILSVTNEQILILSIAVVLMLLLNFIVMKTKTGMAMRAVSFDKDAARLMGINVDNTISATFALGTALAAAAGMLLGLYYQQIDPLMGFTPGLKAFISAVIGGIGSIPGAMIGGLVLGITEVLVVSLGYSTLKDGVAFLLLILVLLIRPRGIFGEKVVEKV
ncbi:MAG: branched-chain amino acid ABC transporter permease [Actinobacteria bacterium]|nr:branched-chain amino acid ABC transporter permease [Actinomycetota bacterium]